MPKTKTNEMPVEIEELKKQIQELTEERDGLMMEMEEMKQDKEREIEAGIELAIEEFKKDYDLVKKEFWEGTLVEFKEEPAVKRWLSVDEIIQWGIEGGEKKKIYKPKSLSPTIVVKTPVEKPKKEGTCNAMVWGGKDFDKECSRDGFGKWCYCKQHWSVFNKGKLGGDKRQKGDWEEESEWREEMKENKKNSA